VFPLLHFFFVLDPFSLKSINNVYLNMAFNLYFELEIFVENNCSST
jgi:hypothetical protein